MKGDKKRGRGKENDVYIIFSKTINKLVYKCGEILMFVL